MKKILYIQDNFLNSSLCQSFIDLHEKENDTFLEAVTHSNENESLSYGPDIPEDDGNYGAEYLGGNVDPIQLNITKDKLFVSVINKVTNLCKIFDNNIRLDYCGVIKWPTGTYMKPHYDKSEMYGSNVFAAFLYLNDDFVGGHTQFDTIDNEVWFDVRPKKGKLLVFSNRQYLHHFSMFEYGTRYLLSFWFNMT